MATVRAMSLMDNLPLAEVKNRLSEVVDRVQREHGRVVITKRGRPAAVVLSIDDLESLEETLEIMGNQPLMEQIRASNAEIAAGDTSVLSKQSALALLRQG